MDQLRHITAFTGILAAALLAGCAALTPIQRADNLMRGADVQWTVAARVQPEVVRIGGTVTVEVVSNRAGYLYLLHVGSDGASFDLAFPNALDAANALPAGEGALPRPGWALRARGPVGTGYFLAVITALPQDLIGLRAQLTTSGTASITGPYGAAMTTVREIPPY